MYRQLTAPSLFAAAIAAAAMMTGCASGSPAAQRPPASSTSGSASSEAAGPGAASSAAAGPASAGRNAFCALARAKGAANLVTIKDQSAAGGGRRQILPRLDALTSAAPPEIRPDFTRLDHLEHALLGGGPADPQTLGQVEDPHTVTSLKHIEGYLAGCGITG